MNTYPFASQGVYNIQPATKPNNMEQAIKRIQALMSENEIVKVNCTKAVIATNNENARRLFTKAKNQNEAYQNAINIIKEVGNG